LQKPSRLPKSRPLRFHKRDTLNKKHSSILLLRRLENIYRRLKKKRKKKKKKKRRQQEAIIIRKEQVGAMIDKRCNYARNFPIKIQTTL
jgi:hypothetical protein